MTLVIVLIVVILYEPPKPLELTSAAGSTSDDTSQFPWITAFDFALPDEVDRFLTPKPWYFREAGKSWTEEDSAEFWVNPRELAVSVLEQQNKRKLDEIFRRVP